MTDRVIEDSKKEKTGSRTQHEPVFLAIGKLRRPHGVDGEWLMDVLTDFPERIKKGKEVYFGENRLKCLINSVRMANKGMLIRLDMENADDSPQGWGNQLLYVNAEKIPPLPVGHFYHHQIIGMNVVDENGNVVGVISSILETGANDVYVVVREGKPEVLLPAIASVILNVDIKSNRIVVKLPEWA